MKFQLTELTQAPLKPQQRLAITQSNVIPGVYHQLVLAKTTKSALSYLDHLIRMRIKAWLKLPNFTVDAYFYTDIKSAGLGLRNIRSSG